MRLPQSSWPKNPWTVRVLLVLQLNLLYLPWRLWKVVLGLDVGFLPVSTRLPHPFSIVIHDDCTIGERCTIYNCVTIGTDWKTGVPSLGNDVVIFPGACIIGDVSVGDGSVVGANSVVTSDVSAGSVVAGAPAVRVGTRAC